MNSYISSSENPAEAGQSEDGSGEKHMLTKYVLPERFKRSLVFPDFNIRLIQSGNLETTAIGRTFLTAA